MVKKCCVKFGVDWIKGNGDIALYTKLPQNVKMKLRKKLSPKHKIFDQIHARVTVLGS